MPSENEFNELKAEVRELRLLQKNLIWLLLITLIVTAIVLPTWLSHKLEQIRIPAKAMPKIENTNLNLNGSVSSPEEPGHRDWLTTREFAEKVDRNTDTVRRWINSGKLPGSVMVEGNWRIPKDVEVK